MSDIECAGKMIGIDDDGFLSNLDDWSENVVKLVSHHGRHRPERGQTLGTAELGAKHFDFGLEALEGLLMGLDGDRIGVRQFGSPSGVPGRFMIGWKPAPECLYD